VGINGWSKLLLVLVVCRPSVLKVCRQSVLAVFRPSEKYVASHCDCVESRSTQMVADDALAYLDSPDRGLPFQAFPTKREKMSRLGTEAGRLQTLV
jgi:hypothetical protein